jgi:hypothetical protein
LERRPDASDEPVATRKALAKEPATDTATNTGSAALVIAGLQRVHAARK